MLLDLLPYQLDGVRYLQSRRKALLFDDPGLGKTAQALSAVLPTDAVVVVCPAYVKMTWAGEAAKFCELTPSVKFGRGSFVWPKPGEIVILNPELLPEADTIVWKIPRGTRVIFDEVHMYKSKSADRYKKGRALVKAAVASGGSAWGLTGTPIMSDPDDLWGILSFLGMEQDVYGRRPYFDHLFRKQVSGPTPWNKFGKTSWGTPLPEASARLKAECLGRSRIEVLPNLPEKTFDTYIVDTSYTKGSDDEFADLSDEEFDKAMEKGDKKVASERAALAVKKAKGAFDYIMAEAETHKVVVFSYHTEPLKMFKLKGWGIITGETPMMERHALVQAFQDGNLVGLAGTIGAMGVGITLTASYHAIFIDLDYQPSANRQAEDRVMRIGQKNAVVITHIKSDTKIDRRVDAILSKKADIITQSVDMARS